MLKKLVIFDGTSILNDAYRSTFTREMKEADELYNNAKTEEEKEYALEKKKEAYKTLLKSVEGKYINAVQEFLKTFLSVLDKQNPSHVAVVWGTSRKTNYKREIYNGYKSDDKEADEPLKEQTQTIQQILEKIGVAQYKSEKYEALDIAGSIASKYHKEIPISIIARNTNSLQLLDIAKVSLKTSNPGKIAEKYNLDIKDMMEGFIEYDLNVFKSIYNLIPAQFVDYRALIGSPLSGIPGVERIGEKTALPLIQHFCSLENLYAKLNQVENMDSINPKDKVLLNYGKSLKENLGIRSNPVPALLKNEEKAFISKQLVQIKRDIIVEDEDLTSSTSKLHTKINKVILFHEMEKINLANFEKFDENHLEEISFSDIIKTFDYTILSPSSESYIGCSLSYLTDINRDYNSNKQSSWGVVLNNSTDYSNKDDYIEDECDEYDNDNYDYNQSYYEDESEEDCTILEESESLDNNDKTSSNKISSNNTFSVLETIVLTRYVCNHCKEEFIIQGKPPKFCPNCGTKNEVKTNIPVIEKDNCSLSGMTKPNLDNLII